MNYLFLGFFTGLSLIFAIGAQNIFVIEQGLKKQYIFLVCLICSISDLMLIFLGIFLFEYLDYLFTSKIEVLLNVLLFIFLIYFITNKIIINNKNLTLKFNSEHLSLKNIVIKTLGFTYLNPHVYSDTVFFLGNFSKNFSISDKYYFGFGAALASLIFFFTLGYLSQSLSIYLQKKNVWRIINIFIIIFMSILLIYVARDILSVI